jgi:serine protease Do
MTDLSHVAESLRRITVEVRDETGGIGAGVLWPAGHVVTNAHVARRPRPALGLVDGRQLEGRLVARDEAADLALVRITGAGITAATPPDSDAVRIGSLVIAVGHPFGMRSVVTVGIVHALGPIVRGGRSWIQADLRLGPGNSGGPVADVAGRVVGVSTMMMSTLAFAVPIAQVQRFVRGTGIPV